MDKPTIDTVLNIFTLNEKQRIAATERGRDIVVTAGAGSGKTSTLVARYLCLLAEGVSPRRMAAITFTKKAAREMRSRVRGKLLELQQQSASDAERQKWLDLSSQMDSARIGTIHSLCSEILRAHPAEAGVDPRFEVLDEGLGAAFMAQAVDDSMKKMVDEETFIPLLRSFKLTALTKMLTEMLKRRLEVEETFTLPLDHFARLENELRKRMAHPEIRGIIDELRSMGEKELVIKGGQKLADMVLDLLRVWGNAEEALVNKDAIGCAAALYEARRKCMKKNLGSAGIVKDMVADLQAAYDRLIDPLVGGKNASDPSPSREAELAFVQLLPVMRKAFGLVQDAYKGLLDTRQALDFDDLEFGAQQLLQRDDLRERWQSEIDYVLVDEFQDTNQRQRDIIRALAGLPGKLFIVGDMRQSIYRFRRADVTVFSDEQDHIRQTGGAVIDLDMTYRAHEPLLDVTGEILSAVIGTVPDPERKYYVPYSPLIAYKKISPENFRSPHLEFVLGTGDDNESARETAAKALAARLSQLKSEGQITNWDEVALLFRASTGYPAYEDAFENAGIPFVTVAGRGFYNRPEVRDLVNILRALADPLDDLSFAGLLRSPAFGLSDAALYLLRGDNQSLWTALQGDISMLAMDDQQKAERVLRILRELLPLVDRVPVSELLKKVVDAVDYRAILATADQKGSSKSGSAGGRLWRNIDKLLEDAQVSQQVNVRSFLEMLATLNDAGAREGEAPAEADGAVRLMTIHKSKGLEFPVVVLADAGRGVRSTSDGFYLSNDLGVTLKLDPPPMLFKLAKAIDKDQNDCERLRLLYVALTRAKSKLIISAHASADGDNGIKLKEWAKELANAANLDLAALIEADGEAVECMSVAGHPLRAWCVLPEMQLPTISLPPVEENSKPDGNLAALYTPLDEEPEEPGEETEIRERIPIREEVIPGYVLGQLVHKAIQRWLFPGDAGLVPLLEAEVFAAGLATEVQRTKAVRRAVELLERMRQHSLWEEIADARERYFEFPYAYQGENRVIDLLYHTDEGWQIIDFKTDPIRDSAQRNELVQAYAGQVKRYRQAVNQVLGLAVTARICFLDDEGIVRQVEV